MWVMAGLDGSLYNDVWGLQTARDWLPLEHDPEKCEAVFRKDHAQTKT